MLRALAALEYSAQPLSGAVDWRLDIAGKGSYLESMKALASELRVDDRIHFHGFVSDAKLQELYDRADLFLMPAVQGYGIPAIESLQRGIPVLLHRESGVSDILLDTPWATVLEGGEQAMRPALTEAIKSALEGRQLAVPLPQLPTEDTWAAEIARLCGWV
jgi:glycosyltransferase involved in cell wall biosynthesis